MALDLKDLNVKKGALDALRVILASRKKPIEVYQNDDDDDKETKVMKTPKNSKVMKHEDENPEDGEGQGETPEERQARINRINDPAEVEKDVNEIRQDTEIRKGDAIRAKNKELAKATGGNQRLLDFKDFGVDLFRAVKSQISTAKQPEDTYMRPNASYANSDYLMPGQDYPEKRNIPVIDIYFDQSGSWDADDIQKGLDALASIRQFEIRKKVKVNLYYFADHLHDNPRSARWEGGTSGFDEVLQNIKNTQADNVIIMSDSDIESQTDWGRVSKVEIPGYVWFLWRYGDRSPKATVYLRGRRGTTQYNLN